MKTRQYQISREKTELIARTAGLTEQEVIEHCCADWAEGQEHQAWLDTAPPDEIAAWVIAVIER